MLALTGVAQVTAIETSRGRFYSIKIETPEEVTLDATLWTDGDDGIIRPPVLDGIFIFTGYLATSTSLELTSFVPALPNQSEAATPPTVVNVTGLPTGPNPVTDHVMVNVEVYLKEKKVNIVVPFKFYLRGKRWENRKAVLLRPGSVVHFLGTLESATTAELDHFVLFRGLETSPEGSPASPGRARKPLAATRAKRAHSPSPGSSLARGSDLADLLSAEVLPSPPNPADVETKQEDRPLKRGRAKGAVPNATD